MFSINNKIQFSNKNTYFGELVLLDYFIVCWAPTSMYNTNLRSSLLNTDIKKPRDGVRRRNRERRGKSPLKSSACLLHSFRRFARNWMKISCFRPYAAVVSCALLKKRQNLGHVTTFDARMERWVKSENAPLHEGDWSKHVVLAFYGFSCFVVPEWEIWHRFLTDLTWPPPQNFCSWRLVCICVACRMFFIRFSGIASTCTRL